MTHNATVEAARAEIIAQRKLSTLARRLKVSPGVVSRVLAGKAQSKRIERAAIVYADRLQKKRTK